MVPIQYLEPATANDDHIRAAHTKMEEVHHSTNGVQQGNSQKTQVCFQVH